VARSATKLGGLGACPHSREATCLDVQYPPLGVDIQYTPLGVKYDKISCTFLSTVAPKNMREWLTLNADVISTGLG